MVRIGLEPILPFGLCGLSGRLPRGFRHAAEPPPVTFTSRVAESLQAFALDLSSNALVRITLAELPRRRCKRRMQNEAYPIDHAWNCCGRVDRRSRKCLGRASSYACDARGEQLARDPRLLLLLVGLRGEKMLVLLRRRQKVLQAVLPALSLPLLAEQ